MYFKKLIYDKIWILAIVLFIFSVLTLNSLYFISNVVQNIYYGVYVVLSIITITIIRNHYSLNIHNGFFILLHMLLIYVTYVSYLNHFIAVPLFLIFPSLLIFPLLRSQKSHSIFKFFSGFLYILLLIIMFAFLFVRLIFTSVKLVKTVYSPNNKQMIEVYSINNGAVGGSTHVYLAEKYCYLFKKNRLIYSGHYGEGEDIVKWKDINHVQIDSKTIDITSP